MVLWVAWRCELSFGGLKVGGVIFHDNEIHGGFRISHSQMK